MDVGGKYIGHAQAGESILRGYSRLATWRGIKTRQAALPGGKAATQ
jgi:hypothetical protein